MLYDDQRGHDALIDGVKLDAAKQTVSIQLQAYPEPNASKRIAIEIVFKNVVSLALNAELGSLTNNRSAGNVNHWHIAEGEGTSHIYLVEGHIAVSSRSAPELILQ